MQDGCFPEDLMQKLLTLLIQRDLLSDTIFSRLLSPDMTALEVKSWKRLTLASCDLIAKRSVHVRRLNLSSTFFSSVTPCQQNIHVISELLRYDVQTVLVSLTKACKLSYAPSEND